MMTKLSDLLGHFFHVVSNIRPIVWIGLYVLLVPVFACVYYCLPEGQFSIPDHGATDFGSWLYYSIVTITTLGFGDYTPTHGLAQAVTAIEVISGLITLGFFLNAVGSMKSEIDVSSAIEKQRRLQAAQQRDRLVGMIPTAVSVINRFIEACDRYRNAPTEADERHLLSAGARLALTLDSLQNRVDLSQWPRLLEGCFTFVADYQLYVSGESIKEGESASLNGLIDSLYDLALDIETYLTEISRRQD